MPNTDLYLLGCGIRGPLHFTTETIQALSSCQSVFVLHDDLIVHSAIKNYCKTVYDLAEVYEGAIERRKVYERISEMVIAEAARQPKVAFACHGHPLFLVSASEKMLYAAWDRGLIVEVLPAVSSLDTILCDLKIDLGYNLQIFDATILVKEGYSLNPYVPLLVFNLATCLNENVVMEDPNENILLPLVSLLSKFYSTSHICTVIHSASHVLEASSKKCIELGELSKNFPIELWKRPTLFLPPIK